MIDFLLGVPGKLKAISDYLTTHWTSARAAKLDFLTANVALASTAVSNVDYTSVRAAKLDNLVPLVLAKPPIAIPVATLSAQKLMHPSIPGLSDIATGMVTASTNSSSLVDVVNYTGSGVIEFLGVNSGTTSGTVRMVVTIDGTVVFDDSVTGTAGGQPVLIPIGAISWGYSPYFDGAGLASAYKINSVALSSVPFTTSLRVQMSVSIAHPVYGYAKFRKVS